MGHPLGILKVDHSNIFIFSRFEKFSFMIRRIEESEDDFGSEVLAIIAISTLKCSSRALDLLLSPPRAIIYLIKRQKIIVIIIVIFYFYQTCNVTACYAVVGFKIVVAAINT